MPKLHVRGKQWQKKLVDGGKTATAENVMKSNWEEVMLVGSPAWKKEQNIKRKAMLNKKLPSLIY